MKIRHLRTKIILMGFPILLSVVLAFYVASVMLILPGFQKIENDSAMKSASRAADALAERLNQLNQKASTWGNSDESYAFMKDHNKTYIENELGNSTLDYLRIDYMLFFDTNGHLVEMKHVNINDPGLPSLPLGQGIKDLFAPNSPLLQHASLTDVHKGALVTPDGMAEIVSRPIINSEGEGPSRGSVVFVKNMDKDVVQEMTDITHLNLTFLSSSDSSVTQSVPAFPSKTVKGTQWLSLVSGSQTQAFSILTDALGKPSLAVRVDIARTISQEGTASIRTFLLVSFLVGTLLLIATTLMLNKVVVSRVLGLSKQLAGLKDVENPDKSVAVSGHDEISSLGTAINDLLARIHSTYDLRQTNSTLEQKVSEHTKELDDQLDQMKRMNDLMVDREIRMRELKHQNAKLRAKIGEDLP
jgi:sensor domain CHASE-containing protein